MKKEDYRININDTVAFNNNAAYCVGTGRMNLALRHEYHKQLEMVQKNIKFSYIRGHGLFCDDMSVYHTYIENGIEKEEYNFTYIDLVFDDFLSLNIKPFVELGFMPEKMASGGQTIFYWKGNVTPPEDYGKWERLVKAAVNHWITRYGREEVVTWPFEVWNEPNLAGFWKDADIEEYLKLYDITSRAVKSCDVHIRIGGPAICGVDDERWMRTFLDYCLKNKTPLDFVTRHAYGTESPEVEGRYVYQKLRPPEEFMREPCGSREIMDSYPEFSGMELHVTEFNTSYSPRNPIHDTNRNAAYIARLLSELGDMCASYSYWTFGDVFEESGVAFTPFSGCFGLLSNGCIPKPTYWTYVFYKDLYSTAVSKNKRFVLTKSDSGNLRAVAWNLESEEVSINLSFEVQNGVYCHIIKMADEITCNPLGAWINMGSPSCPSQRQLEILKECANSQVTVNRLDITDGCAVINLSLNANAVCYFELEKVTPERDRGFNSERISV